MSKPQFEDLLVRRVMPDAAGAVAIALQVPPALRERFDFKPGQYLTLRAQVNGEELRRNYSICSSHRRYLETGELEVGIRPVPGGRFSNWAAQALQAGDRLSALPPEGRFTIHRPKALHRVGFAAGSGITPILSLIATSLEADPQTKFTLVYGNQRMNTVMFNEALQDLKDRYPDRFTMIHILSRQAQEVDLLQGRIDGPKVQALIQALLPVKSMDEVFVCGPEAMMDATESALRAAGVPESRIHIERFLSATSPHPAPPLGADPSAAAPDQGPHTALTLIVDGKTHELRLPAQTPILEAALQAGLDIPYSCKGGVCCTCKGKLLQGQVHMVRNFTLQADEVAQGFVLTCQALALTPELVVSYDER